jgi:hypothetical protein
LDSSDEKVTDDKSEASAHMQDVCPLQPCRITAGLMPAVIGSHAQHPDDEEANPERTEMSHEQKYGRHHIGGHSAPGRLRRRVSVSHKVTTASAALQASGSSMHHLGGCRSLLVCGAHGNDRKPRACMARNGLRSMRLLSRYDSASEHVVSAALNELAPAQRTAVTAAVPALLQLQLILGAPAQIGAT